MKIFNIGRSSSNDIVIHDMSVSSTHARITVDDDGTISITDLGSTNGTYVDGVRIYSQAILQNDSFVKLGYACLDWQGVVGLDNSKQLRGSTVLMNKLREGTELLRGTGMPPYYKTETYGGNQKTIGRDPSCDIRLPAIDVSSKHAILVDLDDICDLEDIELGCRIYTIGFPFSITIGDTPIGLEANNQSGEVTQNRGQYTYGHNITIERGASGSPVFDKYGKFAGIIVSGYLGLSQGYNHSVQPVPARNFYYMKPF